MKSKLKLSFLFILALIPLSVVLTLAIKPSIAMNIMNDTQDKDVPILELFTLDAPIEEGMTYFSSSNTYGNSLSSSWNEVIPELPSFLPIKNFLNIWDNSGDFGLASVPPVVLLLSAGLVGFICIARRSLFTK